MNSRTNKDSEEQRNLVNEIWEQINEEFIKGLDISKDNLDDGDIVRSKSTIEFDLINFK